jgi:hypothetical protein
MAGIEFGALEQSLTGPCQADASPIVRQSAPDCRM